MRISFSAPTRRTNYRRLRMNNGRTGKTIRDTSVMQAIDQVLFESPEMAGNTWLMHRKHVIENIEDEGERAPPLSALFEDERSEIPASPDHSDLNLVEMISFRPYFPVRRRHDR